MSSFPSIHCPQHGPQIGRTRCKWCGFDPFKSVNRPPSSRLDALPRTGNGVGVLYSFPLGMEKDAYQVGGDMVEAHG